MNQQTLRIGDARPSFVFALILATLALFVAVVPVIAGGVQ